MAKKITCFIGGIIAGIALTLTAANFLSIDSEEVAGANRFQGF